MHCEDPQHNHSHQRCCSTPTAAQVSIQLAPGFTPTCLCHPDTYINKASGRRWVADSCGRCGGDACRVSWVSFPSLHQLPLQTSPAPPSTANATAAAAVQVLVGSEQGALQLWNFATGRQVFEFKGWGSGVRCLAASPALDVVGCGLADG